MAITLLDASGRGHYLGANPLEYMIRYVGDWGLRILLAALAITPIIKLSGFRPLQTVRRLTGLWAFGYVCIHLILYFGVDLRLDLGALWRAIISHIYITLGMAALLLMVPLALTSTNAMMRRLGAQPWRQLHQLIYPAAILAVFHFDYMLKGHPSKPYPYFLALALMLCFRVYYWQSKHRQYA